MMLDNGQINFFLLLKFCFFLNFESKFDTKLRPIKNIEENDEKLQTKKTDNLIKLSRCN